jgi:hypothetical protein
MLLTRTTNNRTIHGLSSRPSFTLSCLIAGSVDLRINRDAQWLI